MDEGNCRSSSRSNSSSSSNGKSNRSTKRESKRRRWTRKQSEGVAATAWTRGRGEGNAIRQRCFLDSGGLPPLPVVILVPPIITWRKRGAPAASASHRQQSLAAVTGSSTNATGHVALPCHTSNLLEKSIDAWNDCRLGLRWIRKRSRVAPTLSFLPWHMGFLLQPRSCFRSCPHASPRRERTAKITREENAERFALGVGPLLLMKSMAH